MFIKKYIAIFLLSVLCVQHNAFADEARYCEYAPGQFRTISGSELASTHVYAWKIIFYELNQPIFTGKSWGYFSSTSIEEVTNLKNQSLYVESGIEQLTNNEAVTTFKNHLGPVAVIYDPAEDPSGTKFIKTFESKLSESYFSLDSAKSNYYDSLNYFYNSAYSLALLRGWGGARLPAFMVLDQTPFKNAVSSLKNLQASLGIKQEAPRKQPQAPAKKNTDLPYGVAIAGRPGFVRSPFAAAHQLVDVAGLPVGMQVKCPYTGKLFRVPAEIK